MSKNLVFLCLLLFPALFSLAQKGQKESPKDSVPQNTKNQKIIVEGKVEKKRINPLAPSKAAFYSAVLPGLGQAYNKKYWKIPIVIGAIGVGIYAYDYNNDLYNRFRTAFKRRQAGFTDDEFYDVNGSGIVPGSPDLSDSALQDAQESYQSDRDLALFITLLLYALNIIDANVDAHLKQFNVDDDLGLDIKPYLEYNPIVGDPNYGVALTIKF